MSAVNAEINVTPMADIMLVLLIIFMITTPLLQTGITVNLPKAKNPLDAPEADSKDAVIVALNREGRIYLAKSPGERKRAARRFGKEVFRGRDQQDHLPEGRLGGGLWSRGSDRGRLPQVWGGKDRSDGREGKVNTAADASG